MDDRWPGSRHRGTACPSGSAASPGARPKGFFTDTTVCIGCKACEVACKQWNQLPDDGLFFTGMSYDNTVHLGASTWRHVAFVERPVPLSGADHGRRAFSWLMMSDVCKHCQRAGCLESCPTGAIVRTEFDSVYVQPDICNGCGYCVVGCPFGVIDRREDDGRAWKCTLCYDRLQGRHDAGLRQGVPDRLHPVRRPRRAAAPGPRSGWRELHERGVGEAYLYGVDAGNQPGTEGLNAFFLLVDRPEVYNLPPDPVVPQMKTAQAWTSMAAAVAGMAVAAVAAVLAAGKHR